MHFSIQLSLLVDLLSLPILTMVPFIFGKKMKIMIGVIGYSVVDILGLLKIWIGIAHMII